MRHRTLNAGQVAIAAAETVIASNHPQRKVAAMSGVAQSEVSKAVQLLRDAPEAADWVAA